MAIFGKKNKNNKQDVTLDVENKAENESESLEIKKAGFFKKIRKKVSFKVRLRKFKTGDGESTENSGDSGATAGGNSDKKQKKDKKPKKEKKVKPPKPKKEKKVKVKKEKDENAKGGKKKILLIVIIGVVVLLGAGAFAAFMIFKPPSVDEQLQNAKQFMSEEKYEEAGGVYEKLLKKDDALVEAYLGLASSHEKREDIDTALQVLDGALEPTSENELIKAKIEELSAIQKGLSGESSESSAEQPIPEPIVFEDAAFEKMLRAAMEKPDSSPVTDADVGGITSLYILGETHSSVAGSLRQINTTAGYEIDGELYSERGTIKNLNDLKHLKSLKTLGIGYNSVADISGISELKSLETLSLYFNDISDISPLKGLTGLKFLYIYSNDISDISALAGLNKLEQIWINKNQISDITAFKDLPELTEINISDNNITDISPVAGLSKLWLLHADNNQISDISSLKDMAELKNVSFKGNPLSDYSPVSHVKNVNQ